MCLRHWRKPMDRSPSSHTNPRFAMGSCSLCFHLHRWAIGLCGGWYDCWTLQRIYTLLRWSVWGYPSCSYYCLRGGFVGRPHDSCVLWRWSVSLSLHEVKTNGVPSTEHDRTHHLNFVVTSADCVYGFGGIRIFFHFNSIVMLLCITISLSFGV
jgi:hypothetical protein